MAWPTTKLDVEVSLALGADLTADPGTWSWTVLPDKAYVRDPITITRGRADEASDAAPAKATLTLDNRDGRFVPRNPLGPYFGQLGRNTPIRIRVDAGAGFLTRFVGFVSAWPTRWDLAEVDHHVRVEANGTLRRLSTGRQRSPLRSALFRAIHAAGPVAYWPLEDGPDASRAVSGLSNGSPMLPVGLVRFGAGNAGPGSAPVVDVTQGAHLTGSAPSQAATTVTVEAMATMVTNTDADTADAIPLQFKQAGFLWNIVAFRQSGTPWVILHVTPLDGSTQESVGSNVDVFDGIPRHYRVVLTQDGANIDYALFVDGVNLDDTGSPATLAGTVWTPHTVRVCGDPGFLDGTQPNTLVAAVGHVTVWNGPADSLDASTGHTGELAGARFARLCLEEGIPSDVAGVDLDTYAMGPQRPAKLLELQNQCQDAAAGVMYDRRTGELGLDLLTVRENRPPSLILDYAAGHVSPPLEPTDDDQRTVNDVEVTVAGASSGRVVDELGPLGVATVGRYVSNPPIVLDPSDPDLPVHHAGWRVNLGTVDQARYPTVAVDLRANPSLVAAATSLDVSHRVALANLPDFISYDDVDLIVEGYTEKLHPFAWTLSFVCAPYKPYLVAVLAETDMTLLTAESNTNTSFRIAAHPPFTNTADRPGDFPVAIEVDGELVSVVSAINVGVSIAAGTPVHADNAAVQPVLPAHVEGDVILIFAAIRSSGVGTVQIPAGYELQEIGGSGHCRVFGKYAASAAEGNPTITPSGGAAGDTVSAVAIRVSGIQLSPVRSQGKLNGSAQDIAYDVYVEKPGDNLFVMAFAWKQDDYTSVAPSGPWIEVVEASSTTGADQSLYVARETVNENGTVPVPAGAFVVTGGAAAISRSHIVTFLRGVSDLTVQRSINGVVTSHAQLATVKVSQPENLAL